jgi:acyl carrier protein
LSTENTTGLDARVTAVLTNGLGLSPADLRPEARLKQDLGLDSLDAVELAMGIERGFGVDIDDKQIAGLVTVGDLVTLVRRLVERERLPAPTTGHSPLRPVPG